MQLDVEESTPASDMTMNFNPKLQLAIAASFASSLAHFARYESPVRIMV